MDLERRAGGRTIAQWFAAKASGDELDHVTEADLRRAAAMRDGSPAMLTGDAYWLRFLDEATAAGFSDDDIVAVLAHPRQAAMSAKCFPSDAMLAVARGERSVAAEPNLDDTARARVSRVLEQLTERRATRTAVVDAASRAPVVVDAPPLAELSRWRATAPELRAEIVEAVAAATGLAVVADDVPVAVLRDDDRLVHLIPGGSFEMGLSPTEEARLRDQAAARGWDDDHDEIVGLWERLAWMRPVRRVTVGPVLVARDATFLEPSELAGFLTASSGRLPTEAEWEWCSRGGASSRLTALGDDLPDEDHLELVDGPDARPNGFGLVGLGANPELCADVFAPTLEDLPADGSARSGDGPRVVRGGAAELFPWQGVGEWQLLLNAMRTPRTSWEFGIAVRAVVGVLTT